MVKKCSKCGILCLKLNFHKDNKRKDDVQRICIICIKQYHHNRKEQRNAPQRLKRETDFNFELICTIRTRTNKAFKSQNIKKANKTIDLIGCSYSFLRKWNIHQFYGEMTFENYGKIWCLDHCYPLSKTNLSYENDMYRSTNWINLRPMFFNEKISKSAKIDHRFYLVQEVKTEYFSKLNGQEGWY